MSKLEYRTKPPKKGYVFNESNMQHKEVGFRDTFPSQEIQFEAHRIVGDAMEKLIRELDELGYDPTKAGFYIHFKENRK